MKDSARVAGIHINTATRWEKKRAEAKAALELAQAEGRQFQKNRGGVQNDTMKLLSESLELPPAIPKDRLCPEAQRGLEDFDFFRSYYLGRVPSPWQVEAAYKIVQYLESPEKEFLVLNCPPGAGKSTLFHDVAVWCIVRDPEPAIS